MSQERTPRQQALEDAISSLELPRSTSTDYFTDISSGCDYVTVHNLIPEQLNPLANALRALKIDCKFDSQKLLRVRADNFAVNFEAESLKVAYKAELDKARARRVLVDAVVALPLPSDSVSLNGNYVAIESEHSGQLKPLTKALDRLKIEYEWYVGSTYTVRVHNDKVLTDDFAANLKKLYQQECTKIRESSFYVNDSFRLAGGIGAFGFGGTFLFSAVFMGVTAGPIGVVVVFGIVAAAAIGAGLYLTYDSIKSGKNFTGGESPVLEDNPEIKALVQKAAENYNADRPDFALLDEIHEKYLSDKNSKINSAEEATCYAYKKADPVGYNLTEKNPPVPGYVAYLKLFEPSLEFKRVDNDSHVYGADSKGVIVLPTKNNT